MANYLFIDKFTSSDDLWTKMFIGSTDWEVSIIDNWYNKDNIKNEIYDLFVSKSSGKYFIWDEDIDIQLKGQFKSTFKGSILRLYILQLPLLENKLSDLKDYTNRGGKLNVINESGETEKNVTSDTDYHWDKIKDIPTRKTGLESNNNNTNRISDLKNLVNQQLNFDNFLENSLWIKFEKYFINKFWVDKYENNIC